MVESFPHDFVRVSVLVIQKSHTKKDPFNLTRVQDL